ncbi:hypothetical protein [Nostoc sp. DedQUE09]|nr:hypothetical protein [Nostoc sp. DedQUE09]MDZ7955290.1 hypothetical protein [Nostoc sp. DedQUE09]
MRVPADIANIELVFSSGGSNNELQTQPLYLLRSHFDLVKIGSAIA